MKWIIDKKEMFIFYFRYFDIMILIAQCNSHVSFISIINEA